MKSMLTISLTLILLFCSMSLPNSVDAEPAPVTVGALSELSGPFASIGEECRRGYEIAEVGFISNSEKGRRQIRVHYGDHQRKPGLGISEFRRMTEVEDAIAVASNAAPVVMAINPISKDKKIPFVATVIHPDFIDQNPYAFRFWPNASAEGGSLARKIIDLGYKKVALLTLEDDYPLSVSQGFGGVLSELGGSLVFSSHVLKEETDFSTLSTLVRSSKPEAVFINVVGTQLAQIMKKLRQQKLQVPFFATLSLAKDEILQVAGRAAEGAIFVEVDGEKPLFLSHLKKLFGADKSAGIDYACYTALGTILYLLNTHPDVSRAEELFLQLSKLNSVPLLDEELRIINREAQYSFIFRQIRNGKVAKLP